MTATVHDLATRRDRQEGTGAPAALAQTGATYRQLDYWTRTGRIHATDNRPGSGTPRTWPDTELRIAARAKRLLDAGIGIDLAFKVARADTEYVEITPLVAVVCLDPEDEPA